MVNKTKEHNETHSKALTESVNILFAKISQIEKKSEESLKKQIEALKSKQAKQGNEAVRDNESFKPKGPSQNEQELLQRVLQLEKVQMW